MKSLKIFFTANVLWDIYIFRYGVIKSLIEDGHEVVVVAPRDERIDFERELGIRHIPIDLSLRGVNPLKDFRLYLELKSIYKKEKPDIVFHYTIKPNIYGTIAAKMSKIPNIAILTGLGYSFIEGGLISKIARYMYKFSLRFANEIWVLNEDDKNTLIDMKIVKDKKLFVLPGEGVNVERFTPKEIIRARENIVFLMIARAFYDKGFREYVEAAKIVKKEHKNVEFWFLGALGGDSANGVTSEEMKKIENEGILKYLGHRKDVENIIGESDCVVLPSYREGISKVLMEAASMEKPLIASNVVGCKEIVEDGYNGFLAEVKSVSSLVKQMEKFISLSWETRRELGINGRKKIIKEFDEKIIIDIYRRKIWNLQ